MSNSAGEMAKGDAQACEMARGVAQPYDIPRSDHPPFDMTRYVSQSSDMVRGTYQTFDMGKGAHQPYEMPRGVAHPFEMARGVASPFEMPRTVPQTFEMSRGVHQSFDIPRGVAQQYDMTRGVAQPFEMPRGNTPYDMARVPQNYDMARGNETYDMPRTQPYEMARGGVQQPIDMARGGLELVHPYDYAKGYHQQQQQCSEPHSATAPPKTDAPQPMADTHHGLEVPMEMPKTAPQPTVKSKGGNQKGGSHPFDFAKGYAQQLEMAKRAAQSAIQAKVQAQKARLEAEQAEKAKREAEDADRAKREAEVEKAKVATQPSEILKLYAQQLEMMKNAAKPSEIAKMYARQLETAKHNTSRSAKSRKSGPYTERGRRGKTPAPSGDTAPQSSEGRSCQSGVQSNGRPEDVDSDDSDDRQSEESKGDPPPFEMAKYLAQLSKMKTGATSSEKDVSEVEEEGDMEHQEPDTLKGDLPPSATEAAKALALPFPLELIKNLGLPFGMGVSAVGGARAKRDRQELTIANKAKLIEQVEARGAKKKADIAREWGLRPSTLSTIMKNKDRIMTQFKSQRYAAGRRRMRTAAYPDVEEALLTWFRYARAANIPITGPILQGMGVTLAQELGHPEFSCSVGWLDRFKARHGLSFNPKNSQEMGGGTFNEPPDRQPTPLPPAPAEPGSDSENSPTSWFPPSMPAVETAALEAVDGSSGAWLSGPVPNLGAASAAETQEQLNKLFPIGAIEPPAPPSEDLTSTWLYDTVPSLLRHNKPRDIFSASEAALFYNLLPDRSLTMKEEEGHRWAWVKERLTLMVAVNMDGSEKLPLLVIGQMKDPKASRNVETLPLPYEANDSAMMTSTIFEGWVRQLDEQYQNLNRNIVVLVDTCSAHPNLESLSNVQLTFLPPDTTSKLQPVEQGVIQNLKTFYRRSVLERLIECRERGREYDVTLLEALELLQTAWKQIKPELVVNSFKQAGLEQLLDPDETEQLGVEDEHALLERARRSGIDIPGEVTFESYLNIDSRVQTKMEQGEDGSMDAEHTLAEELEAGNGGGSTIPSEAMQALATLRKFIQEQRGPNHFLNPLAEMEGWVARHIVKPEVSFVSE
ncbi:uncharacterized protein [Panulirus ornatus]|uniref:uncharacterized protein n=1 Tax=Panulirus ornatus TaxID=150431 RepID=UPI003A88142E